MTQWGPSACLSDIFIKSGAFFKMMSTYVNGYNQALFTYSQCKQKNKLFVQFLEKCRADVTNLMDLQSYLIMPVQRLPRYVLLLTELIKYSNPKHPGYKNLAVSLEEVRKVADFVNEAKKHAENSQKMLEIQENLVGKRATTILEPTRKFFGEGNFTWVNSNKKGPRPLRYFLFYDSIMLVTPKKKGAFLGGGSTTSKWQLKALEPLSNAEVRQVGADETQSRRIDIQTPSRLFTVECEDGVNRAEWIESFNSLKASNSPRPGSVSVELKKQNGEINKQSAEIKKQSTEIKKQSTEIKKQSGEINKQSTEIKKQSGDNKLSVEVKTQSVEIKKQSGEVNRQSGEVKSQSLGKSEGQEFRKAAEKDQQLRSSSPPGKSTEEHDLENAETDPHTKLLEDNNDKVKGSRCCF